MANFWHGQNDTNALFQGGTVTCEWYKEYFRTNLRNMPWKERQGLNLASLDETQPQNQIR